MSQIQQTTTTEYLDDLIESVLASCSDALLNTLVLFTVCI